MNQSDHPHGIEKNQVSTYIDLLQETNHAGHIFSFERKTCAHCFKWLGDSSPVPTKKIPSFANPNKRIVIEKKTCDSKNLCEKGGLTASPRDEMGDPENIIGEYCKNCKHMFWKRTLAVFPYTAENLGACKA